MASLSKKQAALLTFGLSLSFLANAQSKVPLGAAAQTNLQALASSHSDATIQLFDNRYAGVKGSPFYLDAFLPGSVVVRVGNTGKTEEYKNLRLKYDAFTNHLVSVFPDSKDTLQFNTTPVVSFTLNDPMTGTTIPFKRFKEAQAVDPKLAEALFAVLHESADGKISLVKRIGKKKLDANYKGAYSANQPYDEILDEVQYFVVANGKMQRVKINRKSFLDAFPEKADKIKTYVASQKIAMATEADMIKVVAYLETI